LTTGRLAWAGLPVLVLEDLILEDRVFVWINRVLIRAWLIRAKETKALDLALCDADSCTKEKSHPIPKDRERDFLQSAGR